jgi:beta-galactosidase
VIRLTEMRSLFSLLPSPVTSKAPLTFEDLDQAYGYVLYRTLIKSGPPRLLKIRGLRDYGIVFIDGRKVGTLDRRLGQDSLYVGATKAAAVADSLQNGAIHGDEQKNDAVTLDILVENSGRINFGPYLLKNKKGITELVTLGGEVLKGWRMYSLPFDHAPSGTFDKRQPGSANDHPGGGTSVSQFTPKSLALADLIAAGVPMLRKGNFELSAPADTYFDMTDWGKGCVWVNGHHLGRYWNIGPQQTLYVPAEWLKKGRNEVLIFEQLRPEQAELRALDHPVLDHLQKKEYE